MKFSRPLLILCFAGLVACSQAQPTNQSPLGQAQSQTTENPSTAKGDEKPEAAPTDKPQFSIGLFNEETGEIEMVPAELEVTPGEKYFAKTYSDDLDVSLDGVVFKDLDGNPVEIQLDKVTLIEYWSAEGLAHDQFWNQFREMEKLYKDRDDIQLISINYDLVLSGKDQLETAKSALKAYSMPKMLLFDYQDAFRAQIPVHGEICYYLIDHRRQLTHIGRGDFPFTQQLFDAINNALVFQSDAKKGFTITPVVE